jgi:hypothetical protein
VTHTRWSDIRDRHIAAAGPSEVETKAACWRRSAPIAWPKSARTAD